jgi:MarR family 2-MHQ and catechol resistance regulon transcriptional repressor
MSLGSREEFYRTRIERMSKELDDFCPEATWAVLTLSTLHDGVLKAMNARLAKCELSTASFNVLVILDERGATPLNEIGTLLIKTAANVTGLVDGLVRRGLVRRGADPADRRVKLAELSPAGRELLAQSLPRHHAGARQLFQSLSKEELEMMTRLMRRVLDDLSKDLSCGD